MYGEEPCNTVLRSSMLGVVGCSLLVFSAEERQRVLFSAAAPRIFTSAMPPRARSWRMPPRHVCVILLRWGASHAIARDETISMFRHGWP